MHGHSQCRHCISSGNTSPDRFVRNFNGLTKKIAKKFLFFGKEGENILIGKTLQAFTDDKQADTKPQN